MKNKTPKERIFRTVSKVVYLKEIFTRLDTEYIPILQLIIEHNRQNKRTIGFWSLIRIIFPVIEAVANISGKQKEIFLEENLNVPFGYLVWEIYRHSLMHTDELRYVIYKGTTTSWAAHISLDGYKHFIAKRTTTHPTTIHLNISELFFALRDFLQKETVKNDKSMINIQVGVRFPERESILIGELEKLRKEY